MPEKPEVITVVNSLKPLLCCLTFCTFGFWVNFLISLLLVFVCFVAFLLNDIYGFYSWKKMEKRQKVGV